MQKQASAAKPQSVPEVATPTQASVKDPNKRIVTLDYPVQFAGEMYPTLTVRRLKAKDLRALDMIEGGGQAAGITIAALICNVDEAIIDELDMVDYLKLQEAIADFFPVGFMEGRLQANPPR